MNESWLGRTTDLPFSHSSQSLFWRPRIAIVGDQLLSLLILGHVVGTTAHGAVVSFEAEAAT